MAYRFSYVDGTVYRKVFLDGGNSFAPAWHPPVAARLDAALGRARSPQRVFVGSMGELASPVFQNTSFPGEEIPRVAVLTELRALFERHPRHTFLLLTKTPWVYIWQDEPFGKEWEAWPNNVHLGTSLHATDDDGTERMRTMASVSATVRWVSVEPLLHPEFRPRYFYVKGHPNRAPWQPEWIVVGGLSGKKPVPAECFGAAIRIRNWCQAHRIPLFVKDNLRAQFSQELWPQQYPEGGKP